MAEVRDADASLDVIARRASAVAAVFSRLGAGIPLPRAARELARLGVPVFPCAPGGKRPISVRGFHDATTDARQVEAWWRQRPAANLAIPTGAASGVVVVDVDVHKVNGYAAFERAARPGLLPEPLAVVTTPTGGRHLYFPADAEHEQRSWQVGRAGIDFRGDGGYIIVPPSQRMIASAPASPTSSAASPASMTTTPEHANNSARPSACWSTAPRSTPARTTKANGSRTKHSPTESRSAKTKGRRSDSPSPSPPSHQHRIPPMSGVLVRLQLWS